MANHLQNEASPYLLQQVDNPVDWYPWGEQAMRPIHRPKALQDDPVLIASSMAATVLLRPS